MPFALWSCWPVLLPWAVLLPWPVLLPWAVLSPWPVLLPWAVLLLHATQGPFHASHVISGPHGGHLALSPRHTPSFSAQGGGRCRQFQTLL